MTLPGRSKFSFNDMRNDVSGLRLGGTPAHYQSPMQTLSDDVSGSWAGGSSSPAHHPMQTHRVRRTSSVVQAYKIVPGYWKDGSSASFHYPMQTHVQTCSELRGPSFDEFADDNLYSQLARSTYELARCHNNFGSGFPADSRKITRHSFVASAWWLLRLASPSKHPYRSSLPSQF